MKRFLQRNIAFKLISLFLAFMLWMYVTNEQDPAITREFKNVDVSVIRLNQNYLVAEMPDTVTVVLKGNKNKLSGLTKKDITAQVDGAGVRLGVNVLPVQTTVSASSVEILETKPAWIQVKVDARAVKQVPVTIAVTGKPAEGLLLLEPVFKPSLVEVTGPQEVLKTVERARADINVTGINKPATNDLPVKLLDGKGKEVRNDNLTANPRFVNVMIPIIDNMPNKNVPVTPAITGVPARGYEVGTVIVEPKTIRIFGPLTAVEKVARVETTPINVDQAAKDIIREVNLVIPSELTVPSKTPVRVVVRITKTTQRNIEGIALKMENTPDGLEADSKVDKVSINVEGAEDVVNKLQASDFKAVVDLSDEKRGERLYKIRVTGPGNVRVVEINPESVTVSLHESEPRT